jgi:hypothetical protein
MPSSPTRPTSSFAWRTIGVISEMNLLVGKKSVHGLAGLAVHIRKAQLNLLAECQQMSTILACQGTDDFSERAATAMTRTLLSVAVGKQSPM